MKAWNVSGKILQRFKNEFNKNAIWISAEKFFHYLLILLFPVFSFAQDNKNSFEIYGYDQTDVGYNFNTIDPDWFDVMRPTKLPTYKNEFGPAGNFLSVSGKQGWG